MYEYTIKLKHGDREIRSGVIGTRKPFEGGEPALKEVLSALEQLILPRDDDEYFNKLKESVMKVGE